MRHLLKETFLRLLIASQIMYNGSNGLTMGTEGRCALDAARKGKDGAFEFFSIVGELSIKDFRVLSIMSNKNEVVAEFIIEADVPATGGHYRDEEMHLWTFDEQGKVIRLRHYTDTAKHIAAAKQGN